MLVDSVGASQHKGAPASVDALLLSARTLIALTAQQIA